MINNICIFIAQIAKDKLLHFILSYIIFDACLSCLNKTAMENWLILCIALFIVSIIIVGKEIIDIYDSKTGFSWQDIIAGYLGVLLKLILYFIMIV